MVLVQFPDRYQDLEHEKTVKKKFLIFSIALLHKLMHRDCYTPETLLIEHILQKIYEKIITGITFSFSLSSEPNSLVRST